VAAVCLGSCLGAFCTTANTMLASRFIEGAGIGLITMVAPAAIAVWFPVEKRGTPLGLWTTCMPIGNIIMFNLAPRLTELAGWPLVWKTGAVLSLAAFVLFWEFSRMPGSEEAGGGFLSSETQPEHEKGPSYGKAMANASLWLITLQFLCSNAICPALGTYYPTFLNALRNYSLSAASFVFSLSTVAAVFSQPLDGSDLSIPFHSDRVVDSGADYRVGLVSGTAVPATFAAVPKVMVSRQLSGLGVAVLALGQNLGMFIGPLMFGKFAETIGWAGAGYALIPVCAMGATAVCLAKFGQPVGSLLATRHTGPPDALKCMRRGQ